MKTLLQVDGLRSRYGLVEALRGIDLRVGQGELVALVGANGAGKTTLLRCISGIQDVAAGTVLLDNDDMTHASSAKRVRRGVCHAPEGRQVFGPMTIADNLRLGAFQRKRSPDIARDIATMYDMFPVLDEKRGLPAGTLSGGQQQMLAMARALMGRPRLLLLDEPSLGLAPLIVNEIFGVVRRLREQGSTILMVEQNAKAALAIADRAYVMESGTITLEGNGQALLNDPSVQAAYLGM